jgi:hypothetical protein
MGLAPCEQFERVGENIYHRLYGFHRTQRGSRDVEDEAATD